jgi:hypothetical protein
VGILPLFAAGAAQKITYDFVKFLILLPIAIILDLIIKAIKKKRGKNTSKKNVAQKNNARSANKKLSKEEKEYIEKSNKRISKALWIVFYLYIVPVICLITASLATVIFSTADVAAPTAIITLAVIIIILLYNKETKNNKKNSKS